MSNNEPADTIKYKGCTIEVWYDEDAGNPFEEFDQLGSIVIEKQRNASFATKHTYDKHTYEGAIEEVSNPYGVWMDGQDWCDRIWEHHRNERIGVLLTFELHNYGGSSGWSLSIDPLAPTLRQLGESCGEINGYIYLSRIKMAEEYKSKYVNGTYRQAPELVSGVAALLRSELETWGSWMKGEVYGYVLKSPDGTHLDSCWGYYGETSYMVSEAKEAADNYLANVQEVKDYGIAAVLGLTGGNA